ncbi:DUF1656 domain-containing protein [Paraferrimonas sedimenticola]|uniref:DUF1656 domain-containing protein n=1 Tax=Paraferrimonas sedimenticola TaxID=375674 RepID=UPI003CCBBA9F
MNIAGVFFSPILAAFLLGWFLSSSTMWLLAKTGVDQHIWAPWLVELSLIIIFGVSLSWFVFIG